MDCFCILAPCLGLGRKEAQASASESASSDQLGGSPPQPGMQNQGLGMCGICAPREDPIGARLAALLHGAAGDWGGDGGTGQLADGSDPGNSVQQAPMPGPLDAATGLSSDSVAPSIGNVDHTGTGNPLAHRDGARGLTARAACGSPSPIGTVDDDVWPGPMFPGTCHPYVMRGKLITWRLLMGPGPNGPGAAPSSKGSPRHEIDSPKRCPDQAGVTQRDGGASKKQRVGAPRSTAWQGDHRTAAKQGRWTLRLGVRRRRRGAAHNLSRE